MLEKSSGVELAKVLWFYNLIPHTDTASQKIVCPFHEDVNPSLLANFETGQWFCFGCQRSGDAKQFVKLFEKKYSKANDLSALYEFGKILKSSKTSGITLKHSPHTTRPPQIDLINEAYDYYYGLRKVNWRSPEASEEIDAKRYMKDRGFAGPTLKKCDARITYNKSYELIFPMLDNGEFKGWVCRTSVPAIEKKRKYLYNTGFSRASTLVGDYGSKDYVFVVEGYMDRLKFLQFGEDNVVAILGWKMSEQQIRKLKDKGIKRIISALDNDDCGKKGTEYLKSFFKVTKLSYLKGVKDPGDTTKETFGKMLNRTKQEFKKSGGLF